MRLFFNKECIITTCAKREIRLHLCFRDSKVERYQKMWRYMESHVAETFVNSYEEGVNRVLNGSYAFLGESAMLDYLVQRNCNLTQIGGLLDSKGYGIATPKGSKWRDKISKAILFLQEKGVIQMYYDKWWKSHGRWSDNQDCNNRRNTWAGKQASAAALGVVNIGGVFVVLLVGKKQKKGKKFVFNEHSESLSCTSKFQDCHLR